MNWRKERLVGGISLVRAIKGIFAAGVLIGQVSIAQSTVVVSDIRFEGELGVPVTELQEYAQFLKGHPLGKPDVLAQSTHAIDGALRHRGFWKAQVTPSLPAALDADAARKGAVLQVTIHSGLQYRVKNLTFTGLASEFPSAELTEAFHLHPGDIADGNEVGVGISNLMAMFKKKGQDYVVIPQMTFDDADHTVSFAFDIRK
ncbi:MAG TPA: hypothetical protein VE377_15355 [Candidatus Dormibacteraeota bacterium]|nr:hypothetical protein [Candidatus Dormibacteraeota bacterium]